MFFLHETLCSPLLRLFCSGRAALTKRTPHPSIIRPENEFFAAQILTEPALAFHSGSEAPPNVDRLPAPVGFLNRTTGTEGKQS
jgi:hypothetical protein